MHFIRKQFGPYPFAHRQASHGGHCKLIHGHNWTFVVEIEADQLDENGFVFDFGEFKPLKTRFNHMFDHTIVLAHDDPKLNQFKDDQSLYKVTVLESASAEGIASAVADIVQEYLPTDRQLKVSCVEVHEDHKNVAAYRPQATQATQGPIDNSWFLRSESAPAKIEGRRILGAMKSLSTGQWEYGIVICVGSEWVCNHKFGFHFTHWKYLNPPQ